MARQDNRELDHWYLVGQGPRGTGPREGPSITIERGVPPVEAGAIRSSNALVRRLAGIAPYARLVEAFEAFEQATLQSASAERRAGEMSQAAYALGRIALELPQRLEQAADMDFVGDSDTLDALKTAIAEECARPSFQFLAQLAEAEPLFVAVGEAVQLSDAGVIAVSKALPGIKPDSDIFGACFSGLVVAQRLIARQLVFYRDQIDQATRNLRVLAAEVPAGAPVLMRDEKLDLSTGRIELSSPSFDPLALVEGQYLHEALRHSERLLRETDPALARQPPAPSPSKDVGELPATQDEVAIIEAEPGPGGPGESPAREPDTEKDTAKRDDLVVDFALLVREATALTDDLERAWSDALDKLELQNAQAELGARLSSLVRSIHRRSEATESALRESGFDPSIARFPIGRDEEIALTLQPDAEHRFRQLQIAELEALALVVDAIQALASPSAAEVTATGQRRTWWEAGAFDLVRRRVEYLRRVSEAAGRAESDVVGRGADDEDTLGHVLDRLRLASDAVSRGDPEAALIHCSLALSERIEQEGGSSPPDPIAHLAACIDDERAAALLTQLGVAVSTLDRGESLEIGAAALLAPRVLELAGCLCFERPDELRRALTEEAPGGD